MASRRKGGNGDNYRRFYQRRCWLTKTVLDGLPLILAIKKRLIEEAGVDGTYLSVQICRFTIES